MRRARDLRTVRSRSDGGVGTAENGSGCWGRGAGSPYWVLGAECLYAGPGAHNTRHLEQTLSTGHLPHGTPNPEPRTRHRHVSRIASKMAVSDAVSGRSTNSPLSALLVPSTRKAVSTQKTTSRSRWKLRWAVVSTA